MHISIAGVTRNVSVSVYSVHSNAIRVKTILETATNGVQIHCGLQDTKKCGQGLVGALFSVYLACLR